MKIKVPLMRGIFDYGFHLPSPIQAQAIPRIIKHKSILAQAQNGTGKTAAFLIGCLERIVPESKTTQVLIVSPTRELAVQTAHCASLLGHYLNISCHAIVGGTEVKQDKKVISKGVHLVSGTPGRILHFISTGLINPSHVKIIVVDETDEILGKEGMGSQLRRIRQYLPSSIQDIFFSATLPPDVVELATELCPDAEHILIPTSSLSMIQVKHFMLDVTLDAYKIDVLVDLFSIVVITQAVIFVSTRARADWLAKQIARRQLCEFVVVHGGMDQEKRQEATTKFRRGAVRLLIVTDVWSRGVDVQQVSLVINYDLPDKCETYIHRVGRSGRFKRKGTAVSFVCDTKEDKSKLKMIEKFYSIKMDELPEDPEEVAKLI
ncbi:ATP-dependent RNA helicase FAL1 [Aduncisulcus paluster]|uniref:RNA helicase n=1 Tax=Aduncisulcus paluster TaxID=2918883 RepID=A0ABQ5KTQ3_9EUKA|nr:ATP-dependent RNA helicase FAL1 [Aduncisulcus paluster]